MSHTAAALVRFGEGTDASWAGSDLDLSDVDDLDELLDALDDVTEEAATLLGESADDGGPVVVFIEEDDEWLGVVRVDGREVRVFLSDRRVALTSEIAERFFSEAAGVEVVDPEDELEEAPEVDDDEDELGATPARDSERPEIEPGGDPDMLTDVGVPAATLLSLAAKEGVLPADVISALADLMGAGTALEELRGE